LVAAPIVFAAGPLVATDSPAHAVNPGPVQITLQASSAPGVSCPNGSYVAVNPGPQQSPVFVLIQPGPVQCPVGSDVLISPGPTQAPTGQAVALPLTAKSCTAGTALVNQELTMLGVAPAVAARNLGRSARTAGCPSGDAALAALDTTLANVPVGAGGMGFIARGLFGPRTLLTVNPGSLAVPALTAHFETKEWTFGLTNPASGPGSSHQSLTFHVSRSGLTSLPAKLVNVAPVITLQPVDVTVSASSPSQVTFTSSAFGIPPPTLDWQGFFEGGWIDFGSGLPTDPPSISFVPMMASTCTGCVRAVWSNGAGTAISNAATITVTP
jgi:hypothetical protein